MCISANKIVEKFQEAGISHSKMDLMELVEWTMDVNENFKKQEYVQESLFVIAESHYSGKLKIHDPKSFKQFLPSNVAWSELPEWYNKLVSFGFHPLEWRIKIGIHFDKANEARVKRRIRTKQVLDFIDIGSKSGVIDDDALYKIFKKKLNEVCIEINETKEFQELSQNIIGMYEKRYEGEIKK